MGAGKLRLLRIVTEIDETSAPYNQFSLSCLHRYDITICTYFTSRISTPPGINIYYGDGSIRGFFRCLKAAFHSGDFDVVHAHMPHVALLFLIACTVFRTPPPPTVYTVHNSFGNFKFRNQLFLLGVFALFKRVVCCSTASLESVPGPVRWLAGTRLTVVQNGVDLARIDRVLASESEPADATKCDFSVIVVGRLIEIKAPFAALDVLQHIADPSLKLIYVGDGHLRSRLEAEVTRRGLKDRVTVAGLVPRDEVYQRLRRADVFLSISHGEGLPVAVLEAMACRCPVILSDIPPHREIAARGDCVPLVMPHDTTHFSEELRRIRRMSWAERCTRGEQCRQLVQRHFSLSRMLDEYDTMYRAIV